MNIKSPYNVAQVDYQQVMNPWGKIHKAISRKKMILLNGANVFMPSPGIERKPNQNLLWNMKKMEKKDERNLTSRFTRQNLRETMT